MTDNQQREEFSRTYLYAVAAMCKYKVMPWSQDDGCIDFSIGLGRIADASNIKLDVQLKSTNNTTVTPTEIRYSLKEVYYDTLRMKSKPNPHYLVVLVLADLKADWLSISQDELAIRKCAYYIDLTGWPEIASGKSRVIPIPRENVFDPQALQSLMEREIERVRSNPLPLAPGAEARA